MLYVPRGVVKQKKRVMLIVGGGRTAPLFFLLKKSGGIVRTPHSSLRKVCHFDPIKISHLRAKNVFLHLIGLKTDPKELIIDLKGPKVVLSGQKCLFFCKKKKIKKDIATFCISFLAVQDATFLTVDKPR